MSGILRRVVFFEADARNPADGIFHRPIGWNQVTTGIGTMYEPASQPFQVSDPGVGLLDQDWEDQMARVDEIRFIDPHAHRIIMGGVHGPLQGIRSGR